MCQIEDIFPAPRRIVGEGKMFLMKIHAIPDVGPEIVKGDWVVVRDDITPADVDPGDIIAVMSDGDAALRTFREWDNRTESFMGKVVTVLHRT